MMATQNQLVSYQYKMAEAVALASSILRKADPEHLISGLFPEKLLKTMQRFYRLYDDSCRMYLSHIKETRGQRVSCRRGCSWCCHQMPSGLYSFEYIYIYEGLTRANPKTLYLPRLLDRSEHLSSVMGQKKEHEDLAKYISRNVPCAFLNPHEGTCDIYIYRPIICRSYFSFGRPRYCHPRRFNLNSKDKLYIEPSEMVKEALLDFDSLFPFKLSPIMSFGILEFIINIMRCRPIRWIGSAGE